MSLCKTKFISAFILFALYVVSVGVGFIVAWHRYWSLKFGNLDYGYFIQFVAKAFDNSLEPHILINPDGHNMFLLRGLDGYPGLWHWIHFEPIKILDALAYALFHSPLASFELYVIIFFLPLLYGAYLLWKRPDSSSFVALTILACALYPSSFIFATDYLRPFALVGPAFLILMLSLLYRRPLAEKLIALNVLLSIREEAAVLAGAALLWEMLRNRKDAAPERETLLLIANWGAWLFVVGAYFVWSGYRFVLPLSLSPFLFGAGALLGLCGLVGTVWLFWRAGERMWPHAPIVLLGLFALGPVMLSPFLISSGIDASSPLRIVYGRYGFFVFYTVATIWLAYVLADQSAAKAARMKKWGKVIAGTCVLLFVVSEAIPHPSATWEYVMRWKGAETDSSLVFRAASEIPKDAPTLLDTTTLPAFYAHNNIYAYDFLPAYLNPTSPRTYPANVPELRSLISSGISFALLANADAPPLLQLLNKEGRRVTLVEHNGQFSLYHIQ